MYKTWLTAGSFLFITALALHFDLSFTADLLDTLWALALSAFCIFTILKAVRGRFKIATALLIVLAIVFYSVFMIHAGVFSGEKKEQAFSFENNYILKVYTVALGFADLVTQYKLYQKIQTFPVLEKYVGITFRSRINYVDFYPKAQPRLLEQKAVIIDYDMKSDTLQIIKL